MDLKLFIPGTHELQMCSECGVGIIASDSCVRLRDGELISHSPVIEWYCLKCAIPKTIQKLKEDSDFLSRLSEEYYKIKKEGL